MSEQTASSYPLEDGDGNIIYPPTLTSVVFDENGKRLDTVLANIPRLGKNDPEPVDTIPRDADTLGGHAPDYFATNDSLNKLGYIAEITVTNIGNTIQPGGFVRGYIEAYQIPSGYYIMGASLKSANFTNGAINYLGAFIPAMMPDGRASVNIFNLTTDITVTFTNLKVNAWLVKK